MTSRTAKRLLRSAPSLFENPRTPGMIELCNRAVEGEHASIAAVLRYLLGWYSAWKAGENVLPQPEAISYLARRLFEIAFDGKPPNEAFRWSKRGPKPDYERDARYYQLMLAAKTMRPDAHPLNVKKKPDGLSAPEILSRVTQLMAQENAAIEPLKPSGARRVIERVEHLRTELIESDPEPTIPRFVDDVDEKGFKTKAQRKKRAANRNRQFPKAKAGIARKSRPR